MLKATKMTASAMSEITQINKKNYEKTNNLKGAFW